MGRKDSRGERHTGADERMCDRRRVEWGRVGEVHISSTLRWTAKIAGTESTENEVRAEEGKRWASADGPWSSSSRARASATALRWSHKTPSNVVGGKCVSSQRKQRCGLPLWAHLSGEFLPSALLVCAAGPYTCVFASPVPKRTRTKIKTVLGTQPKLNGFLLGTFASLQDQLHLWLVFQLPFHFRHLLLHLLYDVL